MRNHFKYTTKVWLTGIIATPAVFCGIHFSRTNSLINPDTVFRLIGAGWIVGGLLSMPIWLLSYVLVRWIDTFPTSIKIKKVFIQGCALLLAQGLFMLFDSKNKFGWRTFWVRGWDELPFYYWCALSLAIWYFKFSNEKEKPIARNT